MDARIEALTPWQRIVYDLCWTAAVHHDERGKEAGRELDRMKKERSVEYEQAFQVWTTIMYEILY